MNPIDKVLAALAQVGCPVTRGSGRCPAHDDSSPSLSVGEGADGKVLLKCHAGCSLDAILSAANLDHADLSPPRAERTDKDDWTPHGPAVARYRYTDAAGKLLFEVVRCEGKRFLQRRPDPTRKSGWLWKLGAVERPLYRLPAVIEAVRDGRTIHVCEGEKDVHAVVAQGGEATCNPGGAGKWRKEHSEVLRGADVVVISDRDKRGHEHAAAVAASVAGVGARVRIVEAKSGKDAHDHLAAGHSLEELVLVSDSNGSDTPPPEWLRDAALAAEAVEVAGDYLNAQRFLAEHGRDVRYSPQMGRWLVWTGSWWDEDRLEAVQHLAGGTIDGLRTWAGLADGHDEFERRSKHYTDSAKAARRDGMLSLARSDPSIAVAVEQLDSHAHLLACRNGTVDLRTGKLRAADRADLITRGVHVDYAAGATSEEWQQFLETIFDHNPDTTAYCKRLMGYAITGETSEHILAIFHGTGANGKSAIVTAVERVLGQHAVVAPEGLLVEGRHEQHPERLAVLRGRRLVVSSELEHRATLAEALVKLLTGGDRLSARHLYGHRFDFDPSHTVVLITNHAPRVRGTDHAMWRRLSLVPFAVQIPKERQIKDYGARLAEQHGEAILAWLVAGAVEWYRDGLGEAEQVRQATADYRQREDVFGHFLAECTIAIPGRRTKVKDLRAEWLEWAREAGIAVGRDQDFTDWLTSHGVEVSYRRPKFAHGLGLLTEETPDSGGSSPSGATPRDTSSGNSAHTRTREAVYGRGALRCRTDDISAGHEDAPPPLTNDDLSRTVPDNLDDDPPDDLDAIPRLPQSARPLYWDLPPDIVGVCRFCREVAVMTDETGPVCRACRGSHHTANVDATGDG
jgi:putative DNA primase/helicase